jgi:hypothetical protein
MCLISITEKRHTTTINMKDVVGEVASRPITVRLICPREFYTGYRVDVDRPRKRRLLCWNFYFHGVFEVIT